MVGIWRGRGMRSLMIVCFGCEGAVRLGGYAWVFLLCGFEFLLFFCLLFSLRWNCFSYFVVLSLEIEFESYHC
jgi:hypothetical protein